jgi:dihydrofolate synthase/folylpolyglutamate synthase
VSAPSRSEVPSLDEVEAQLLARWPETRIEPSLDRITRAMTLLGDPQRTYRSVHLTGTNGKTSTARIVEALLAASGERTGRLTSPHLTTIRERIGLGGEVIGVREFLAAYVAVAEQAERVDAVMPHPMSFFELTVAMAYRAFAEAAVGVAVVEVGMGGRWDATNVIDAEVAVLLPVDLDHTDYLGPTTAAIAREKAGIIKPGAVAVSAPQSEDVAAVFRDRARSVGARLVVLGEDVALLDRQPTEGGQLISVRGLHGTYRDVLLALRGRHQAENAACAIVATEAVLGRPLDDEAVRVGLANVASPGRFDVRPGSPPVVLDAAHNPHGARALVASLAELAPRRTCAVVAVMADKDFEGMLHVLEPVVDAVVCTGSSSPRSLAATELAACARHVFGAERVHLARDVATAIDAAKALAATGTEAGDDPLVLVTGSVVTVGDADRLLPSACGPDPVRTEPPGSPDRPVALPLPG